MLRIAVLSLLLLNILYFAWSEGRLPGLGPEQQTEPQRLGQQLNPNAIQLLSEQETAPPVATPAAVSKVNGCLQAGLFSEEQGAQLRSALASTLPSDTWTLIPVVEAARWIVYMGKYASPEVLARKRAELASLDLQFEPIQNPELQLGLSLGAYDTQAAARSALEKLRRRGVRTAQMLQERPEVRGIMLRLTGADDELLIRSNNLKPMLGDKDLAPCK